MKWVVVLGAGYNPNPDHPPSARPNSSSLARLAEGIRIHRKLPGSKLIVLVGEKGGGDIRKQTVRELAEAFGVREDDLRIEQGPRDTVEEVIAISGAVGDDRFVLVTSASHLPRAVRLCQDKGLQPIPAPADYQTGKREFATLHNLPSPGNLGVSQTGLYEFLASAWRGRGR